MGLQDVWGPLLAWDLFLGGAGAGAYLIGVVAEWLGGRYRRLAKPGIYAGPVMVAVGALLLLIELGRPLRFWRGFLKPGSSMMSIGIILISLFIVLGFLHILFSLFPKIGVKAGVLRWLGIVTAVIGVGVILYTGLLLGLVKAVPFWNTPLLPMLFLVSALLCGLATVMLILGLWRWVMPAQVEMEEVGESFRSLIPLVVILVVVEVLMLFSLLFVTGGGQVTAAKSAKFLVAGGYATAFWVGLVVVGLLVPLGLVIWVVARRGEKASGLLVDLTTLAAFCLLVGGLFLRYAVVAAGANVSSLL
jgi:formate-dependent nitrite reductase membrane component NrfD